jgi:hypothetical protein
MNHYYTVLHSSKGDVNVNVNGNSNRNDTVILSPLLAQHHACNTESKTYGSHPNGSFNGSSFNLLLLGKFFPLNTSKMQFFGIDMIGIDSQYGLASIPGIGILL